MSRGRLRRYKVKIDVIRFEGSLVAEFTTFTHELFEAFGLPPTLQA
jgi:hypothetical protein